MNLMNSYELMNLDPMKIEENLHHLHGLTFFLDGYPGGILPLPVPVQVASQNKGWLHYIPLQLDVDQHGRPLRGPQMLA